MTDIQGTNVAFLATDGFEDSELTAPWDAVVEAGADARLVSPKSGSITGAKGHEQRVDLGVNGASVDGFDALVLPGGVQNADQLRMDAAARDFARAFFEQHKPVGVICHGAWILIEAGVVDGRTLTSYPSLRTDLQNAGANWVDEEVVVDQGLVSSRTPDDLPAFCAKLVEEIGEGPHPGQTV
ncbi:peptidase C56 [Leucobacter sp. OLJS4]|uniref:type 1 glutamine amidotransferase domain-containing protein n=1 Tax=unclassified Leucobacter TaxID=2621730 RepID=UPI000C18322D|nr:MULTISPECIES: type 1 glutamine amidotransferase domain-containing protein [unclassified Leucobacter]PIJ51261.1 peptidase C56 [Leucobacter sp. OLES1]PII83203.1 peptidase C56 [Leucobacter sp. OLCALW19]PII86754.1 peptidase C56 [Leucobacter sp. OLTLW20]PII91310.1 peptidase C56 [Leucobacter sp. OLAS13]PII98770.1 peptidase C56 [Leucobacter sp. OLDS2]